MSRYTLIAQILAVLVTSALLVTSCAPVATPVPSEEPTSTSPPEPAPTSPPEASPTPEAEIPRGGTMTLGFSEVPLPLPNLNPYTGVGWAVFHPWQQPVLQGLLAWDPDGQPVPILATEVPTQENGGVSEDGTTITYHLRPNVKWADGESFTCEDVKFTVEALHNPNNVLHSHEGSEFIEGVQCTDDLTAVFEWSEYYAPWQAVPELILPEHVLSEYPDMNSVPWNEKIFGTGPFMVTEQVRGDHIVYEPNPYYWEEGKPYLDKFVILFIPDVSAGLERFKAGEIDAYYYFEEDMLPQLESIPESEYALWIPTANDYAFLYVNLSPSSGPNMANPDYANPVLGDVRVRQAVEMAIDKQGMCDAFRGGKSVPISSMYPFGFFSPPLEARTYDPEGAKALLEEAGWVDTDGDGIRECHGCLNADEGDLASLKFLTISEIRWAVLTMEYAAENLTDVGFDVTFEAQPMDQIWGSVAAGGSMATGDYDLAWSGDRCPRDPQSALRRDFYSSNAECPDMSVCYNWSLYRNPEFDAVLDEAATEIDSEGHRDKLFEAFKIIHDDAPEIFLHSRARMALLKPYIKGMNGPYEKPNGYLWATTYIHYVYIEE